MLFLLLGTAALSLFWFLIGRAFLAAAGLRTPAPAAFEWHVLLGALVLASASQSVHFMLPLPSRASALVLGAVFVALVVARRDDVFRLASRFRTAMQGRPALAIVFLLLATLITLTAARPFKVEDTGLYHAPLLRWAESARLVPGLALSHGRLGFNSLWFPLEAVLSFAFLGNGSLPLVNTAVFLIGALWLSRRMVEVETRRLSSLLALAAFAPYIALGFLYAGSQSPDLPTLTYGLIALLAAADALETRRTDHAVFAVCFAAAAVYWKLSALPLLLVVPVVLWHSVRGERAPRRPWVVAGAFLVVSGLMVIGRSVILSGYPLFPSTALDVPSPWRAASSGSGRRPTCDLAPRT